MKTVTFVTYTVILLFGVFYGCAPASKPTSSTEMTRPTDTPRVIEASTVVPAATATTNPKYQEIVAEILRFTDEYNAQVERFRQMEGAEIIIDPQTGTEKLELSQEAIDQLTPLYETFEEKIHALGQEYWELYQKEHPPAPLPTDMSKQELKQYEQKLISEFETWVSTEMRKGTAIKYFDPGPKVFTGGQVGESNALYRWKWEHIVRLSALYAAPEQDLMRLDIQNIQRIEPGEVTYIGRSANPAYRVDIDLTTYETAAARYDVYTETNEVIEIVAKSPATDTAGERAALEKRAREWVTLISPGWNIENLAFTYNEKVNVYFFRWTDTSKPLLDDGRTHPFIQVGLNGNGELLTYYNTLPLSH